MTNNFRTQDTEKYVTNIENVRFKLNITFQSKIMYVTKYVGVFKRGRRLGLFNLLRNVWLECTFHRTLKQQII